MASREDLERALALVRRRIDEACRRAGRDPSEVTLVAVTKTVPLDVLAEARRLGLADFGENYAKELAAKAVAVDATWHFLGKLQRGTAAAVADHADVIHSAEPGDGLQRVGSRAAAAARTISALVQVDFSTGRQGVAEDDVEPFLRSASSLPGIRMTGLMTLPPPSPSSDPEGARPFFVRLRALRERLQQRWPELQELSMGMSADYAVAVEEGATMVRVGTALFGARPAKTAGRPEPEGPPSS